MLVTIDNKPCQLQLCDTAGQDEFDSIRPLCYNHTDVFLVSFSVVSPRSFRNIRQKWLPEIRRTFMGNHSKSNQMQQQRSMPPFILIGTQCDLRHDVKVLIELDSNGEEPISSDYARNMAKKLGAICYIECSALTQKNLKEVFDSAILAGLEYQKNQHHKHPYHHHHHHRTESIKHQKIKLNDSPKSPFLSRRMPNEFYCSHTNENNVYEKNSIYQDYGHRHFLPCTPPKLAQISDAKLVSWRKSLTKLSAQEALKSEAAEANREVHSHYDDDDDEHSYYEYHPYYHAADSSNLLPSNVTTAKLSTFSPLPSPITSPKYPKSTSNNAKNSNIDKKYQSSSTSTSSSKMNATKSKKTNSSKSAKSSSLSKNINTNNLSQTKFQSNIDQGDQTFQNGFESSKITASHCHNPCQHSLMPNSPQKNRTIIEDDKRVQIKNDSSLIITHKKRSNNKSNYSSSSGYQPSPPLSTLMSPPSTPLIYHPDSCYKFSSPQNSLNNPYAMTTYVTPYGTTVTVVPAAVVKSQSPTPIYQTNHHSKQLQQHKQQDSAPSTPIVHNRSIFHQLHPNFCKSEIKQSKQQRPSHSSKTNLATTLRSSSFFFLPSNTMRMMKKQRETNDKSKKKKDQKKKLSKSNLTASSVSMASSCSSSSSSSSIHSSNELFRTNNQSNTNKSMLDLFHQIMSTSVTELRNRKSSMFRRLASSLSSSSGSSHHSQSSPHPHNNTSSLSGCSSKQEKQKLKLKSEKLKDFYYYDSYDYEEIDLDRRGKCCGMRIGNGNGSLWSCCFPRSF
ncbi:uncharacterized protein LOC124492775 isoform X2 [Dermatophagoides farinae]|uniref:uncharacterized protein LOC124492775 isoform X2 n=1 Tax=Dermatophagoides farinae TaxID=6954 RepID=UPI003F637818